MSQVTAIPDALHQVAALIKTGDSPRAKLEMRDMLNVADPESLALIGRCAATLQQYPHRIAVAKMDNARQQTANETHRALIAACTPEQDTGQYLPQTEPDTRPRYGRDNYRAPRDNHRSYDPTRRKAQRTQRQARQEAAAARYFAERAGVAEGQQIQDRDDRTAAAQVYASGLDYDKAARPDMRGLPCLACWLERAAADIPADPTRSDDGLCGDCRERGRPGIPALPVGHTRADAIAARCATITARTGTSARGILRREWQRYTDPRDRATVADWVNQHQPPESDGTPNNRTAAEDTTTAAVPHANAEACQHCAGVRQVRRSVCLDCRQLDRAPVPNVRPAAVA